MKYNLNLKQIGNKQLPEMQFQNFDVLTSKKEQMTRDLLIQEGLQLSNDSKQSVTIIFQTKTEICVMESAITERTGDNILLRNNTVLPVQSIYEVIY